MAEDINAEALAKRATLPASNHFSIQELLAMPPYFGWVECDSGGGRFRMLLGGNDDAVALYFFWNGVYEETTLKLWAQFAKATELALDIGAHTGSYTLAAKAANPDISVACFEPHFMNFARLILNLRANRLGTGNAFMQAVGAKNETLPFSILTPLDFLTSGGSIGARPKGQTTMVQVVAMDTFLPDAFKPKVGLVKIDTEGFEGACLEGMRGVLAVAQPVIFFECIEAKSGADVQNILAGFGYRFFEVDDNVGTVSAVTSVSPHLDERGKPVYGRLNRIALPPHTEFPA